MCYPHSFDISVRVCWQREVNCNNLLIILMKIDDPRQDEKVLYPLHEVLFLVLVMC